MKFINVKILLPYVFPPHNLPHSQVRLQPHVLPQYKILFIPHVPPHTPFLIPPHVSPHVFTSHLATSYAPCFLLPHLLAHIYNTPTITPCFALCIPPQLLLRHPIIFHPIIHPIYSFDFNSYKKQGEVLPSPKTYLILSYYFFLRILR